MNGHVPKAKWSWPVPARYITAGLVAAVCLLIFLNGDRFNETVRKISEEIFLALSAAIVISLIVDIPTREGIREDIKTEIDKNLEALDQTAIEIRQHALAIEENAYKTAFAGQIPRDFVGTIQSKAFRGAFLRESIRATWRLEMKDGDHLIAQVDSSSLLVNVTDTFQVYSPRFFFDERQGNPTVQKIVINSVVQDLSKVKLERASETEPDLILKMPDQEIQPHGQVQVFANFSFERTFTDWELWTTLYPCRSMNLRVYYPDSTKCKKEYFKIDQLGNLFFKRYDHETYVDIDVQDKILPDQGLLFAWRFVPLESEDKLIVANAPAAAWPNTPAAS